MNGSEYIAEFLHQRGVSNVFLMTGGACAFIIDAIERHPQLGYTCFHHEQGAAMAADAVWRTTGIPGVTVATSGPGATNLITGIACSYFDSIPSIHITGQINLRESAQYLGADVRQAGFQETKIVDMVRPITKYAVQVTSGEELRRELEKAWNIAISDRKGPVLIDVPMNVQQEDMGSVLQYAPPAVSSRSASEDTAIAQRISEFFRGGERPLAIFGAGPGLAGAQEAAAVEAFLNRHGISFVASWNGMRYFDNYSPNYHGTIGVYGNRGANCLVQNCDRLLVLGSRLDNRQRGSNTKLFAISAEVLAIDVDGEELRKYAINEYRTIQANFAGFGSVLDQVPAPVQSPAWRSYVGQMHARYFGKTHSQFAERSGTLSPYAVIERLSEYVTEDAVVIGDTGAAMCWLFQTFLRRRQAIFTAGGNSPMGYALPAAIGAALVQPGRQVIAVIGDGGMQLNIQELQVIREHGLPITIIVMNNGGYGIIKQFQDLNFAGRYAATGHGYSCPDFSKLAEAYGIGYQRVEQLEDIAASPFSGGARLIDVIIHPNTVLEPKLELGNPLHDQFPYLSDSEFIADNPFVADHQRKTRPAAA
jgi:acetolactate synthase-1/2/3 large subunit